MGICSNVDEQVQFKHFWLLIYWHSGSRVSCAEIGDGVICHCMMHAWLCFYTPYITIFYVNNLQTFTCKWNIIRTKAIMLQNWYMEMLNMRGGLKICISTLVLVLQIPVIFKRKPNVGYAIWMSSYVQILEKSEWNKEKRDVEQYTHISRPSFRWIPWQTRWFLLVNRSTPWDPLEFRWWFLPWATRKPKVGKSWNLEQSKTIKHKHYITADYSIMIQVWNMFLYCTPRFTKQATRVFNRKG